MVRQPRVCGKRQLTRAPLRLVVGVNLRYQQPGKRKSESTARQRAPSPAQTTYLLRSRISWTRWKRSRQSAAVLGADAMDALPLRRRRQGLGLVGYLSAVARSLPPRKPASCRRQGSADRPSSRGLKGLAGASTCCTVQFTSRPRRRAFAAATCCTSPALVLTLVTGSWGSVPLRRVACLRRGWRPPRCATWRTSCTKNARRQR
jgi:hypothetical protein